jgi:hypothetical protein
MSASLSPGIDSLILSVARPLDSDGVTPRDDLIGLKVWYSTTTGFDPSQGQGTLAYDGAGLTATISGLTARTTYYVKYALISEIEPDYYAISSQLSATPVYGSSTVDVTPPPTPTGVTVSSAVTSVFIQHDNPVYSQGRGHKKTHVYAMKTTASTPAASIIFANATKVAEFTGTYYTMSSNPGVTWHIWLKWETNDGYFSAVPSGGTSGDATSTGQDVTSLLGVLNNQLTTSQLSSTLNSRIDLIDAQGTGLVTKIGDLQTVYGSTASAAKSAADADAAKVAAIVAQGKAETAQGKAETAFSSASGSAKTASDSATAAYNSWQAAAVSETNAGNSAGAASKDALSASTKAGEALSSAGKAATSETNAAGSAKSAASSYDAVKAIANDYNGTVQTLARATAGPDGATAQYTVKVQANGYVAGFGLSSEANAAGTTTSNFAIVADKFSIAPVASSPDANANSPFFVVTIPTTVNGVVVPAGTYIKTAFIADATITSAKISDLSADKIKTGTMSASRIDTKDAFVDNKLQSTDGNFIIDFKNKYISITV